MFFFSSRKTRRPTASATLRPTFKPRLEALEDRCLMSAGALDSTFGSGGLVTTAINSGWSHNAVAIQVVNNNADVVVAGMTHNSSGMADIALARYLPNGTLDNTFGTGGLVTTQVGKSGGYNAGAGADAVAIQGDGKIVVAGSSYSLASGKYPYDSASMLARYNVDGTLDTTFGNRGVVVTDIYASNGDEAFKALAIQSNGEIVAAGFAGASFTVARYTATGSLDSTFNGGGVVENRFISSGGSGANAVTVQSDGKIVAAGQSNNEFAVARYNTDGALDTGFNSTGYVVTALGGNGYANTANGVVIQPLDGKIDVAGYVGGGLTGALLRFNPNGSLDSTFGNGGEVLSNSIQMGSAIVLQSDGKVVMGGQSPTTDNSIGGDFEIGRFLTSATTINGVTYAAGSSDPTFGAGGFVRTDFGGQDTLGGLAVQADGKIVAAGLSKAGSGQTSFALARYLSSEPQIGSFTASSNPATVGSSVTLTASNITDGNPGSTITQVAFYYFDSVGAKHVLGYGTQTSPGVWTFNFTVNLTSGTYTLYAQAEDSYGVFGDPLALTLQVS